MLAVLPIYPQIWPFSNDPSQKCRADVQEICFIATDSGRCGGGETLGIELLLDQSTAKLLIDTESVRGLLRSCVWRGSIGQIDSRDLDLITGTPILLI